VPELDEEELALALDTRIARLEGIENTVSAIAGFALAVPYFMWWYANGVIRLYSWVIPFFIGGAIAKLGFAIVEHKLEVRRKALAAPKLPEARLLEAREPAKPAPRPPTAPAVAPEPAPDPPAPGEEPRLLK
jgi:hypothetical protein